MPATEHAPLPKPLPTPRDDPPSPRRSELLLPLQPTISHVEPAKPKEKSPEPERKPSPEPKSVKPQPPSLPEFESDKEKNPPLELINMDTFGQILELDEDEETHDFSRPMVSEYFEQAEKTFAQMDKALAEKDLLELSDRGHFLKGSSAALGLSRVQNTCEMIQHHGHLRDEEANVDLTREEALERLEKLLKRVKREYIEAQIWLKEFFGPEVDA